MDLLLIGAQGSGIGYLFQRNHSATRLLWKPAEAGRSEWQFKYRSDAEGALERDTRPPGVRVMENKARNDSWKVDETHSKVK